MISEIQIKNLVNKFQTTEVNIRREYIQHLFLSYFYQDKDAFKILFKGGTALRLIYNSPRFSEDLDFSCPFATLAQIEKPIEETLISIEREGIKVNLGESKVTSGGYLGIIGFALGGRKVNLQLNISQRAKKLKREISTIVGDFIPPFTIMGLRQDALIEEKIDALTSRQKARDFYDFYFILRANLLQNKEKKFMAKVYNLIKKSSINYDRELKILLPKSQWGIIKDFKNNLIREVNRFI